VLILVIVTIFLQNCMLMLLLGYLEFVINNAFMKIFATKSCDIANECVLMFFIILPW